jgi:hypothetical protein
MVGAKGFEPSTSWSRTRRASQAALRPDSHAQSYDQALSDSNSLSQPRRRIHSAANRDSTPHA